MAQVLLAGFRERRHGPAGTIFHKKTKRREKSILAQGMREVGETQ